MIEIVDTDLFDQGNEVVEVVDTDLFGQGMRW